MAASPTIDDIFEVLDVQMMNGQQVLNAYFYYIGDVYITTFSTNAELLARNWADQILPDIAAAQTEDIAHQHVRVRNLYDPSDSFDLPVSVGGGDTGNQSLPNFASFGFQEATETAVTRKGQKRIAGVGETDQIDGVITDAGKLALLATLSDKLTAAVQVGLLVPSDVFFPCVVKRVRSGSPGSYTYSLPDTRGAGVKTRIIGALLNVLVTSQTTRKIGVGI